MTRPTVWIGGEVQGGGGGGGTYRGPDWITEGAMAAWPMMDTGATFEDTGDELWDIPRPTSYVRSNQVYREKRAWAIQGTGTALHLDAQIVDAITLCGFFHATSSVDMFFCCYTGAVLTGSLWGVGILASGAFAILDKRHGTGSVSVASYNIIGDSYLLFASRSATGVWNLYSNGRLILTSASAAAPVVAGTETVAIYAPSQTPIHHLGLWDSELSEAEIKRLTKLALPSINL